MAKATTVYACSHCGAQHRKWFGQCPECGQWNTIAEEAPAAATTTPANTGYAGQRQPLHRLAEIEAEGEERRPTGLGELDRVLGGGLVQGAVVLVGGDPGIGKSTMLLQASCHMSRVLPVLYVSGEESLRQIALRAGRLRLETGELSLMAETVVEDVIASAAAARPVDQAKRPLRPSPRSKVEQCSIDGGAGAEVPLPDRLTGGAVEDNGPLDPANLTRETVPGPSPSTAMTTVSSIPHRLAMQGGSTRRIDLLVQGGNGVYMRWRGAGDTWHWWPA